MCSCREGSFSSPFHLVCLSYLFPLALPVLLQTGRPLEKAGGCTGYPSLFAAWPVNVPTGPRPALWGSGRAVEPVDWCVATSVTVGICMQGGARAAPTLDLRCGSFKFWSRCARVSVRARHSCAFLRGC
ncbi:hypothetical protein B0H13DRAFT_610065 [Mycena leptocephala]|nr:hypothetical protein B0H13DRAFT_610065 [Mycena leptocephala]